MAGRQRSARIIGLAGTIGLRQGRTVNCVSSWLHRDSVCPVNCETSLIMISRRWRTGQEKREETERERGSGLVVAKREKRARRKGARARAETRVSVSAVFNSRQSTALGAKVKWSVSREETRAGDGERCSSNKRVGMNVSLETATTTTGWLADASQPAVSQSVGQSVSQ